MVGRRVPCHPPQFHSAHNDENVPTSCDRQEDHGGRPCEARLPVVFLITRVPIFEDVHGGTSGTWGTNGPKHTRAPLLSALQRYRDEDVASGENILDNWGLLQACFRDDPALEFKSHQVNLKHGWTLADLTPSPRFAHLWRTRESMTILWSLVKEANSRFVRVWAMDMLRCEHATLVSELAPETLLELLDSHDGEVQDFAAALLQSARGLETTPLSIWLRLVQTKNPTALAVVCDVMKKHVNPDRLTLDTMLNFATSRPTPIARMGLELLKERTIESVEDRDSLSRLAQVQCAAVAAESTTYALSFFQALGNL